MMFRSKTSATDLVRPGRDGDRSRAELLEEQVKYLATTAAQAVDRASELERELETLRAAKQRQPTTQETLAHWRSDSGDSDRSLFSNSSSMTRSTSFSSVDEKSELLQTLEHERRLRQKYEKQLTGGKKLGAAFGTVAAESEADATPTANSEDRDKRLHQLEVALTAIHRARRAISKSQRYI